MFFVDRHGQGTKVVDTNPVALFNYVSVYVHSHPIEGEVGYVQLVGEPMGATVRRGRYAHFMLLVVFGSFFALPNLVPSRPWLMLVGPVVSWWFLNRRGWWLWQRMPRRRHDWPQAIFGSDRRLLLFQARPHSDPVIVSELPGDAMTWGYVEERDSVWLYQGKIETLVLGGPDGPVHHLEIGGLNGPAVDAILDNLSIATLRSVSDGHDREPEHH